MNTTNFTALKELLREVCNCLFLVGTSTDKTGRAVVPQTMTVRDKVAKLEHRLKESRTFEALGGIAAELRAETVQQNFYPPATYILLYERLVAIKVLHDEGILSQVSWAGARSLKEG